MIVRLALALGVLAACANPARAQIPLRIRAESRLELRVEVAGESVVLAGHLRDDLGAPIASSRIGIVIADAPAGVPPHRTVTTDREGSFAIHLPFGPSEYFVRAQFAGDAHHDATEAERTIRPGLDDVRLTISVPVRGVFDLDVRVHPVTVIARGPAGPVEVYVELFDELGRRLGRGRTNALGRIRFELISDLLGAPGSGRLLARSEPDARHAASQTEVPIVRLRPTRLELDAHPRRGPPGAPIALEGRLFSSEGALAQEAVALFAGDRLVETVLTGTDGSFRAEVPLPDADAPSIAFTATYEPNGPARTRSASSSVEMRVETPSPLRPAARLVPPLLLAAVFVIARMIAALRDAFRARPSDERALRRPGLALPWASRARVPEPARTGDLRATALAAFRATAEPWLESPERWPTTTNRSAAEAAPEPSRSNAQALAAEIDRIYYGPLPPHPEEVERFLAEAERRRKDAGSSRRLR